MNNTEQQFLKALDAKLWKAADKLRSSIDAANYKHIVLGLIFLKYISDAFEQRQDDLTELFQQADADNIYYLDPSFYDSDEAYDQALIDELEIRDYYTEKNIFWVPKMARWDFLQKAAALPANSVIAQDGSDKDIRLRSVSWLIDNAMDEIERANDKLKNVLNRISGYQLPDDRLKGLIDSFSDTSFANPEHDGKSLNLSSKDILGHVYEYFLGQFALAEGKKGGQYYTPKSIVNLIVEMLQPCEGRVYDPAMGSGGFFISSDKFITRHADTQGYNASEQRRRISVYGQESNPTTWKLAAMNLAIRGIDFDFGKQPADSFLNNQHPDLRADCVMANPPFNVKDWWHESLDGDARWQYGTPPAGNANFAWLQHMLHHLAPTGRMALLLANGSMSSNTNNEGTIRQNLIKADLVECMIALPGQLFTNTQIPACIWILNKAKVQTNPNNKGKVLFIDARNVGYMKDRVLRDFTTDDIANIADTYHAWQHQSPSPSGRGVRGEGKKTSIDPKLIEYARELRKNQTDAENLLWQLLRNRRIADAKFRRQHPIGNYIADFYCHEHKLIIELDGSQHHTEAGKAKDAQRDAFMAQQGLRVLRFDNRQMLTETEAVLQVIHDALIPSPSPTGRRELSPAEQSGKSALSSATAQKSPNPPGEGLGEGEYQDIAGFCKSASLADIAASDYVLTPGRYVGAEEVEDDGVPFAEKMQDLTAQLHAQFEQGRKLESEIVANLAGLGYGGRSCRT